MENYICDACKEQLKIENGEFLFTYNIKCKNGHNKENIYVDDLFLKKQINENLYK